MDWKPNNLTREAIGEFLENMVSVLPGVMGIDEVIAGCQVIDLDPYGVGVGTYPRYIKVALRDRYHQDIMYRGGLSGLAVGDYVTVVHMRDGNRYELMTAGGSTGVVVNPAPVDAQYVTMALDGTLTDERVLTAGEWLALTDGGAGGNATLNFEPDHPVVVSFGGVLTEYATVKLAIDAAVDCETVLIPPGTYPTDIILKNGVCVKGWGPREKIRIIGDEDIVTTAAGGWLENVTIIATDPPAGAMRQAVDFAHAAGICHFRNVTVIVSSTANAQSMHAINSTGVGSGLLVLDEVEIDISVTQAGSVATAIRVDDSYELDLKNFKVEAANTGAAGGDDTYGLVQISNAVFKAAEGWITTSATGAGASCDIYGDVDIYAIQYDTSKVAGVPVPTYLEGDRAKYVQDLTVTVGPGATDTFATIQAAIDWFKQKIIVGNCFIDVAAGVYDEAVEFSHLVVVAPGYLMVRGDTRAIVGLSYVDGADCNQEAIANAGTFAVPAAPCTLALNAGRDQITVAGGTVNPDFAAAGIVNGDKLLVFDNGSNCHGCRGTAVLVNSISPGGAGNNVIELQAALPVGTALGNDGTAICLLPDREINRTAAGPCVDVVGSVNVQLKGFYLETHTGAVCRGIYCRQSGRIRCYNVAICAEDDSIYCYADYSSVRITNGAISMWCANRGAYAKASASILARFAVAVNITIEGFKALQFSYVWPRQAIASHCGQGFEVSQFSHLYAYQATAIGCTTGYYADSFSYMTATSTNARNLANTADYNPAVSCVLGNCNACIEWS